MSNASSLGLNPSTTPSQKLCIALRGAVNDATFGKPLVSTEVVDYEAGRPKDKIQVSCEVRTQPVQVTSNPSGGGSIQSGVAELSMSGPYLDNGVPRNQPSSFFLNGRTACRGEDDPQLGTLAATVWCSAEGDTADGHTVMYFNDLVLSFEMQAPLAMTNNFTYEKFVATRTSVLNALTSR